jgi:hypothetical protein
MSSDMDSSKSNSTVSLSILAMIIAKDILRKNNLGQSAPSVVSNKKMNNPTKYNIVQGDQFDESVSGT